MTSDKRVSLCDGKYVFYTDAQGTLRCDRHGLPWREFVGDKAVHALFDQLTVEYLRGRDDQAKAAQDQIDARGFPHDPDIGPDGVCRVCGQYEAE